MYTSIRGHKEVVKLLLSADAQVDLQDKVRITYAVLNYQIAINGVVNYVYDGLTFLHLWGKVGFLRGITVDDLLLLSAGTCVTLQNAVYSSASIGSNFLKDLFHAPERNIELMHVHKQLHFLIRYVASISHYLLDFFSIKLYKLYHPVVFTNTYISSD